MNQIDRKSVELFFVGGPSLTSHRSLLCIIIIPENVPREEHFIDALRPLVSGSFKSSNDIYAKLELFNVAEGENRLWPFGSRCLNDK